MARTSNKITKRRARVSRVGASNERRNVPFARQSLAHTHFGSEIFEGSKSLQKEKFVLEAFECYYFCFRHSGLVISLEKKKICHVHR